jgi:hypothetical protein
MKRGKRRLTTGAFFFYTISGETLILSAFVTIPSHKALNLSRSDEHIKIKRCMNFSVSGLSPLLNAFFIPLCNR